MASFACPRCLLLQISVSPNSFIPARKRISRQPPRASEEMAARRTMIEDPSTLNGVASRSISHKTVSRTTAGHAATNRCTKQNSIFGAWGTAAQSDRVVGRRQKGSGAAPSG